MSSMLPLRRFNRTQTVRIGGKEFPGPNQPGKRPFTLVNLDNSRVQRDYSRHSTLGAITPLYPPFWQADDGVIDGGGTVAVRPTGLVVDVAAAAYTTAAGTKGTAAAGTATIGAADATNPRVDTIALNTSNGAIVVIAGTATSGAQITFPVGPNFLGGKGTVPANRIVLAYVLVPATATNLLQANVVDARP